MIAVDCASDGVTDVTLALQDAINNARSGGGLLLLEPAVSYLISRPLVISQPITIIGEGSLIVQSVPNAGIFQIKSSNVTIENVALQGYQYTAQHSTEAAISVQGPSAASPLTSIEIFDCTISNFGMYGIVMQYVNNFTVTGCTVQNIFYTGIMILSCTQGFINGNQVYNIVGPTSTNAYGIAVSRAQINPLELTSDPVSSNITVSNNIINGVPGWQGLDTHAGHKILFLNNQVTNCYQSIAVVSGGNHLNVSTYGPKDCVVMGNMVDATVTDGSAPYGIIVSGAGTLLGTATDAAEGCAIVGNTLRNCGPTNSSTSGAINAIYTLGLVVSGNVIINPGTTGIAFYHDNLGFSCVGNVIQDPWTNSGGAYGIWAVSFYNKGLISGNASLISGNSAKNVVLTQGINITSSVTSYIIMPSLSSNYSDAATPVYDPGSVIVVTVPTMRTSSTASNATPTPNADTTDEYILTALAAGATFGAPTGTPKQGQRLTIRVTDNGSPQTLAWNAIYRAGTISLPLTTTTSKTMYVGFIYNTNAVTWDCVAYVDNL